MKLQTYSKRSTIMLAAIIFLMAGMGVYFVLHSFASTPLPTGNDEAIIEYTKGHNEVASANLLQEPETLPFRLYGTGLAICGDYPDNDTSHPAQYYAQQLSQSELNSFIDQFDKGKLSSLDQTYVSAPTRAIANSAETITYNTKSTSTQVTVFRGDSAIPKGYRVAQKAITDLCARMTQPYVADNVDISTKKVDPKLPQAQQAAEQLPDDVEAPIKGESIHLQTNDDTGKTKHHARANVQNKGSKFYKTADGVMQVVITQRLKEVRYKKPTNPQSAKTAKMFGATKAQANAIGQVRYALFCPNGGSCIQHDINAYASTVRDWYNGVTGKSVDVVNIGTIIGNQPASYYQSSDSNVVMQRILEELNARGYLISSSPLELIAGFSFGPRTWCGVGVKPELGDFSTKWAVSLTDPSSPGEGYICSGDYTNGSGHEYKIAAHELGHNFSLWHTTGSGQEGGIMGYDYHCYWPYCGLASPQVPVVQSNPLFSIGGSVNIIGKVTYGGKPVGGMEIETCTGKYPTTASNGIMWWLIPSGSGFCIRSSGGLGSVSGPSTNNNAEHITNKSYEYQIAGVGCYHICNGAPGTWDINVDFAYDLRYAEARAVAVKPGSTQGQKLDSWGKLLGWGGASSGGGILFRDWNIARAVALNSAGGGYVLDGFGGLHAFGGLGNATGGPYWRGWDIARDVKFIPGTNKGYVLDGIGNVHAFNGASQTIKGSLGLPGDLAKKLVMKEDGKGGYTLDAYGGIHPFGIAGYAAPPLASGGAYWPGWDIARSIVINPAATKGYVLDGFGGIHPFKIGSATLPPKITNGPYWPSWDIARDIVITNWNTAQPTGYVLDGYGGMHKFGG